MFARLRFLPLVMGLVLISACKPAAPTTKATDAEGDAPAAVTPAAKSGTKSTRGLLIEPNRKSFAGTWGLVMTQAVPDQTGQASPRDFCVALVELNETGGEWSGKTLATLQKDATFTAKAVQVKDDTLDIDFLVGEQPLQFNGRLANGIVRGTLQSADTGLMPVVLRPTNETTYEGWDPTPPSMGLENFAQAMSSKDQPQAVIDAANENRGTALAINAYESVIGRLAQYPNLDDAAVRKILDGYIDMASMWGARFAVQAKLNVALSVAMTRRFPSLALELADAAAKEDGSFRSDWDESLTFAREQAQLDLGLKGLKSKDAEAQKAAFEQLQALLPKQRYNPELLDAIAIYAEKTDQKPLAKQYFAEIVSLPMLEGMWQQLRAGQPPGDPTPRERLLKIWEDEHGNLDGFEQYLDEVHHQRMAEIKEAAKQAGPTPVPADQQQRMVLVELFTGTACPPCIAADVGLAAVQQTYPTPQLVVLGYHQHIPGPDPLTNLDSEDRFSYYEGSGTPTAAIDGQLVPPPGVGGLLQHTERAYLAVRKMVDQRFKSPAAVKIAVTAKLEGDELVVEAAATDFPADQAETLRLRLALAENQVDFTAPNGIRDHEFVVRKLLGGAKGIAVKSGRLTYSLRMPFADVKKDLTDYLAQFESGRDHTFLNKPLKLEGLSVVGWVQNDETRDVLGTAITTVEGQTAKTE